MTQNFDNKKITLSTQETTELQEYNTAQTQWNLDECWPSPVQGTFSTLISGGLQWVNNWCARKNRGW